MLYYYTDLTVYRLPTKYAWHAAEAYMDGVWKPVTLSERDVETLRPITEEQAGELNALDPFDRVMPSPA